jgi:hypothetical protein
MTASDKYDPPQPDKRDTAYALARAGLSSVPYVGGVAVEVFQLLLASPLEKRRQDWMEDVGAALRDLEENRGIRVEDLQSNDAFIDTVLKASQIAFRSSQQAKRQALRNAVLNAGLPNPPEEALQQMFLDFIDTFTAWHLRLLKLFHNVWKWGKIHDHEFPKMMAGSLAKILESAYPELRGNRDFYDQVWTDLHQRGLVNMEGLHTTMSEQGLKARRTSELGARFLKFIEEPE